MDVKKVINTALRRTTGYELNRVRYLKSRKRPKTVKRIKQVPKAERLLKAPVFVLSSVRSGSTLLRSMLGAHSALYAPHELHLNDVRVNLTSWFSESAMADLGFDRQELTELLWDRVMDISLRRSGKQIFVDKTPKHVYVYKRIAQNWEDARFIFLLRHPASIYQSWHEARPHWSQEEAVKSTLTYLNKLEEARRELTGIDVRYEDLTTDPEGETKRLCTYLGLDWEPGMINYGENGQDEHFRRGLGDWSGKIKSGKPQEGRPLPSDDEIPAGLRDICRSLGYLEPQHDHSAT